SDDNGATWTPQQAWDAGIGHDTSTPFVAYTTDTQGNPYFGLAVNASSNPATCSAESTAGTVQSDPSCEYDMYVVWSNNGGATWTVTHITTTPMHVVDICNLGIFCLAPSSNRNLLDFIMEDIDPGCCAHIAYADDNTVNKLRAANQTSGPCLIAKH